MAQYGSGEQYVQEGDQSTNEYGRNPLHSTTAVGQEIGATGTTVQTHGYEQQPGKHEGGILHRSGSGSSSSSEDDGEGGRRKKKGVMEKIKEKLPGGGGDHAAGDEYKTTSATAAGTGVGGGGGGYGYEAAATGGEEGHEKKGLMEKIKEKLPGGHQ